MHGPRQTARILTTESGSLCFLRHQLPPTFFFFCPAHSSTFLCVTSLSLTSPPPPQPLLILLLTFSTKSEIYFSESLAPTLRINSNVSFEEKQLLIISAFFFFFLGGIISFSPSRYNHGIESQMRKGEEYTECINVSYKPGAEKKVHDDYFMLSPLYFNFVFFLSLFFFFFAS